MTQRVLVSAANGRTGRAICTALAKAGAEVRAFIRNPAQVEGLKALGFADVVVGDMLKPETIGPAVAGCQAVVHIGPPMHADEKLITQHFVTAAMAAGVQRFVYYSVMHPLRREVPHHARKLDTEEMIIESGVPYTIVQPIRYMQHLEGLWKEILATGVHAMPFSTRVKFNVVDLMDLADATAKVATHDGHIHATYELAGPESLSQDDMAAIIGDVLKRKVTARQVPLDEMAAKAKAAGATDQRIETMRKMNAHYDHSGFLGNANVLQWLLGRAPTRFRAYVERLARRDGLIP
ncbi:MAG: NmrA family NAD(P)-binding protein [Rhodospirillaceae bacterium]|nr:NmrA family NAD(P)-binding protein [Rhodospirillaceae bacterium]